MPQYAMAERERRGDNASDRAVADAFSAAVTAQLPGLKAYATTLTRSGDEAEDLLQDALVRIWRYRASFQPEWSLRAWMFRVLKNEYLTQRIRKKIPLADEDSGISEHQGGEAQQEWRLYWREVIDALDLVPSGNREALLLVVALGHSYSEAARICGCDVTTLKGRVHRARARLAALTGWDALASAEG